MMWFNFDPAKDVINQNKHGVSLADAASLEWDYLIAKEDDSMEYDEVRMKGFAPLGNQLYCVIYTDREPDERRIISLRLATNSERREYVKFLNAP